MRRTSRPNEQPGICQPGSPEQQLDMCEVGRLRGDEVLRHFREVEGFRSDLSEENPDEWENERLRRKAA